MLKQSDIIKTFITILITTITVRSMIEYCLTMQEFRTKSILIAFMQDKSQMP